MTFLVPERQYDPALPELIENPQADFRMLSDELKSIRTINRFFGGRAALRRGMTRLLADVSTTKEITVLDLGTGSADLPVYLIGLARRLGRTARITAVDNHPLVLNEASRCTSRYPEITIESRDILNTGYSPGAFDIVTCSLTLHHFSENDAVQILRSMNRLSRIGFILIDLNRSWMAAATTRLYTFLTTRNPMTRTDACLSVLRGFTPREVRCMAEKADLHQVEIQTLPFFRILLVGRGRM